MKRICNLRIYQYLILGLLLALLNSCDTEVDPKLLPVLTTTEVVKMTEATAYSGGNITSDAGNDVISRGVCWSESPNPTIEDKKTNDAAGTGEFESRIVGLNPSTTYYIRAYATNKKGVGYGLQVTFKTKSLSITTTPITAATINTAFSGGTIVTDGDSLNVTERGICWNTSANPTILNSKMANGKGKGNYSGSMADLQIATQYYVRAYATNLTGTFYGDEIIFNTTNGSMTLTTKAATSITAISATIGGNVPNDGGATVTERGFCISKLPNPTIINKIVEGSGVGSFASNITNLEANTTYYVRVFATNSVGTAYGNEISFTTKDGVIILTTKATTEIALTTAKSGGIITSDGGATITNRGICWSTTPNPKITGNKTNDGLGTGAFTSSLTGLEVNTIYYVRAYSTNKVGTTYGEEVSFTTGNYAIGAAYLGGKIAYLDASGVHGFVCAIADIEYIQWYNGSSIITGAKNSVLETTGVYGITKSGGRKNTDAIILNQGQGNYAAAKCAVLTTGGAKAGDWYLPSQGELNQLYVNKNVLGGFQPIIYWSSTEGGYGGYSTYAYYLGFGSGTQSNTGKNSAFNVRAIRAF